MMYAGDEEATRERLNVVLNPEAVESLAKAQARSGSKKADIANRAIVLYEFIEGELQADGKLVLQREGQPDTVIRFF